MYARISKMFQFVLGNNIQLYYIMYIIAYTVLILIIITSIYYSTIYVKHEYYANALVPKATTNKQPEEEDEDSDPDADQYDSMDADDMDESSKTTIFESPRVGISTRTVNDPPSVLTNQYQCDTCAEEYKIQCDDVSTDIKNKQAECNNNCAYYSAEDRELRSCIPACYLATHPTASKSSSSTSGNNANKPGKCNIRDVMNIFVLGPNPDMKTPLSVSQQYTIADVKNEIQYKIGIPFLKQKMTLGNTLLDNNKTLEYYKISNDMNVYLTPVRQTIYDCYKCANRMRKKTLDQCYDKCQYFNYENNQNMPCDAACNFKISKHKSNKKPDDIKAQIAK